VTGHKYRNLTLLSEKVLRIYCYFIIVIATTTSPTTTVSVLMMMMMIIIIIIIIIIIKVNQSRYRFGVAQRVPGS